MKLIFVLLLCTWAQGGGVCTRVASYSNHAQCEQQADVLRADAFLIRRAWCVPANN